MSQESNIALHKSILPRAKTFPVGSTRRMELIQRSLQGILRALVTNYNPEHA